MVNQKLYGFWEYDLCPFMLGAEILRVRENGYIVPVGYGGASFKPMAILAENSGKKALENLKGYQKEFTKKTRAMKRKYRNDALANIGLPPMLDKD